MSRLALVAALTLGLDLVTAPAMQRQQREPLAWQASVGPFTGNVKALLETESGTLFASANAQIYRSTDDGVTWIRCQTQPAHRSGAVHFEPWLLSIGRRLYSSGDPGGPMYVSDDECASSRAVPPPGSMGGRAERVTAAKGALLAAYDGPSVFISQDDGQNWEASAVPPGIEPRLATRGGAPFLVLSQRLYRSADRGRTWTQLATGGPLFHAVVSGGSNLYATASGGIWRSVDDGQTWTRVLETALTAVTVRGSTIYASVFHPGAIARSTDEGRTWTRLGPPLQQQSANALLETRRGTLLAATGSGIFRSTDAAASWKPTGLHGSRVHSLVAGPGRSYASVNDGSLWQSEDSGLTWSRVNMSFVGNPRPLRWPVPFGILVLGEGTRLSGGTDRDFVTSADGGSTWSTSGLSKGVNALVRLGNAWFAATWEGVFRSDDLAKWTECSTGLQPGSVRALAGTPAGELVALEDFTAYRSTDDCRSWWPVSGRLPGHAPDGYRTRPILVSDAGMGVAVLGDGIAQLSLSDRKWIVRSDLPFITAFARDDQGRYWLGGRDGVSRLFVEGIEWRIVPMGLEGPVATLAVDPGGYLIASVDGRGIFRARLP